MLNNDGYRSDVALAPCGQHRRGFSRMDSREQEGIGTTRRNRCTIGHNRLSRHVGRGCGTARFGLQLSKYAALLKQCVDEELCRPIRHRTLDISARDWIGTGNATEETGIWV